MSAVHAFFKVPLDVGGVTANTVDKSRGLLICAREAVPHFRRGEAQVSDVKSVSPSTFPRTGVCDPTLVSMSGRPPPLINSGWLPPRSAGQWREGVGASACEAMLRGLNITDAQYSRGSQA